MIEVGLTALGRPVSSRLPPAERIDEIPLSPQYLRLIRQRSRALLALALVFGIWGTFVCLVGLAEGLSLRPFDIGWTPSHQTRARLLTSGGATVIILALAISLGTLPRDQRRHVWLRIIRDGFWFLGLGISITACFHLWGRGILPLLVFDISALALGTAAHLVEGLIREREIEPESWLKSLSALARIRDEE